jgi:RHS repeat-associated protein
MEAETGDALFATTFMEYDGFGNLTRTINPRGAVTTNVWDALGRLVQRKSFDVDGVTLLSTEGFGYEPGGQVRYHTNALGGVTETQYTTNGLPKFRRNADGSTNAWRYYLDGRLRREIQSNGAYSETTYDDANRRTTRIFNSAAGSPLATNVVELDRRGNVFRSVDAAGSVSTNLFDGLDRLKAALGPAIVSVYLGIDFLLHTNVAQRVTTYIFDSSGQVLTVMNALGEKTITTTDALGRVTRTEIRSAGNTLVRETDTAWFTNHQGAFVTEGSGATKVERYQFTDNEGHPAITMQFTSTNRSEYTLHNYDLSGNPVQDLHLSTTGGSTVSEWAKTYTHDGLNRLIIQVDRDNAVTTNSWDAMGNLTNQVNPGSLKWQATYNSAGQMLKDWNVGTGSMGARTNSYAYYASNSAFAGLLQTRTDNRGVVCTFAYDDWLRPATNTHDGPLAEHDLTTTWTYDVRGLVTNITESFASSNTGPATVIARSLDAYGAVLNETLTVGGVTHSTASQNWDTAERRTHVGFGAYSFTHTWQADGLMTSDTGTTGGGSYAYDTAGQLNTRTVGSRTTHIGARDGAGRPLIITNTVNGTNALIESMTYTGDGLLATHTVTRPDSDFTDSRVYTYASLSRRLTEERLNLDSTKLWTNSFIYDNGTASGAGVLTRAGQPAASGIAWKGGADGLLRINNETNSVARRPAYGKVNGLAKVTAFLDGLPIPVTVTGTNALDWRTTLEMTPGSHQLLAYALHPSLLFSTNKSATETNNAADRVEVSYSADGQITNRVWKRSGGQVERTQSLAWDARGLLYKVTERDSTTNGYDWTAVYDALGRRLRTTTIVVTNNVALTTLPTNIRQYYDPLVEFLELAVVVNGLQPTWKLYGPDLNGVYGGLNGTGGFDAYSPDKDLFCPTVSDLRGNILAVYDQTHGTLSWNASRPTGYGAVPGYRPLPLGHGGDIIQSSAWRGRWDDITGLTWLGARYYDPVTGSFLSYDPIPNGLDPNGYTFAGGEPVRGFDPDGRLMKPFQPIDWDSVPRTTEISDKPSFRAIRPGDNISPYNPSMRPDEFTYDALLIGAEHQIGTEPGYQMAQGNAVNYMTTPGSGIIGEYVGHTYQALRSVAYVAEKASADSRMVTVLGSGRDVAPYVGRPGFNTFTGKGIAQAELDTQNALWLNNAIQRGDEMWLVTDPVKHQALMDAKNLQSAYLNLELPMLNQYSGVNAVPKFVAPPLVGVH